MSANEADSDERLVNENEMAVQPGVPAGFRRLRWDEPVLEGDYVVDEQRGFELWEGPSGFLAGSFVKPIYRREKMRAAKEAEKS